MEIFYKELSYEHIQQQVSFQMLTLLSEIGGLLGLLLGASVLTLFEFIDFVVVLIAGQISLGCCRLRRRWKMSTSLFIFHLLLLAALLNLLTELLSFVCNTVTCNKVFLYFLFCIVFYYVMFFSRVISFKSTIRSIQKISQPKYLAIIIFGITFLSSF